jgi:hypothetical protein
MHIVKLFTKSSRNFLGKLKKIVEKILTTGKLYGIIEL